MIDKNSKMILKYLMNVENEIVIRKDLNNILNNSNLEQTIIAQLIQGDLVSFGDLGPDRIYITLNGKEALLETSMIEWVKRNFLKIWMRWEAVITLV